MSHQILHGPRILLSAYACDPDEGSESGAGWAVLRAASELAAHVTVLTRARNAPRLELLSRELSCPVEIIRIETPFDVSNKTYFRYIYWLIASSLKVRSQPKRVDIFHHATFASDWMPPPVLFGMQKGSRVVWGPVGGNTYPPFALALKMGLPFLAKEIVRRIATSSVRFATKTFLRRRIDSFIALNEDSKRSAPSAAAVRVYSNCVIDYSDFLQYQVDLGQNARKLLFVGRLLEWKGVLLAIEALSFLDNEWSLHIIGDGPLGPVLRRLSEASKGRLVLHGRLSRTEVLHHMSSSRVLMFPSVHDSAPWTVAEAAACGLPVICLDLGGAESMAGSNAVIVKSRPAANLPKRLATAVLDLEDKDFHPQNRWSLEDMVECLRSAYECD